MKAFIFSLAFLLLFPFLSNGQSCSYTDSNGDQILVVRTIINVSSTSPNHSLQYELRKFKNGVLDFCANHTTHITTCQGTVTFFTLTFPACSQLGTYTHYTNNTCSGGGGGGGGGGGDGPIEFEECCY